MYYERTNHTEVDQGKKRKYLFNSISSMLIVHLPDRYIVIRLRDNSHIDAVLNLIAQVPNDKLTRLEQFAIYATEQGYTLTNSPEDKGEIQDWIAVSILFKELALT